MTDEQHTWREIHRNLARWNAAKRPKGGPLDKKHRYHVLNIAAVCLEQVHSNPLLVKELRMLRDEYAAGSGT